MRPMKHSHFAGTAGIVLLTLISAAPALPPLDAGSGPDAKSLIRRAKVWLRTDIPSMDLKAGPQGPGAFAPGATITCDYLDKKLTGASPKFACRLPDGDELKVKYGGTNGEVYGEVAASRLLWPSGSAPTRCIQSA